MRRSVAVGLAVLLVAVAVRLARILKGTFTFANWGEKSGGQLNFRLVSRYDKEIWAGSVADKIKPGRDSMQWVAQDFAKQLKKRKEQAAKADRR